MKIKEILSVRTYCKFQDVDLAYVPDWLFIAILRGHKINRSSCNAKRPTKKGRYKNVYSNRKRMEGQHTSATV